MRNSPSVPSEIIEGAATSPDTLARAARLTRRLGKIGVVAGVGGPSKSAANRP